MTVRDILPDHPVHCITVRTNSPFTSEKDGIWLGGCAWDGEKLISLDGDDYYLDDEIYQYRWDDGQLIYWIKSEYV